VFDDDGGVKIENNFNKKYNFYDMIFNMICDKDYMKMKKAFKLPIMDIFYHVQYLNDKFKEKNKLVI